MFDKIFKVVIVVFGTIMTFWLWTGLDVSPDDYDDPNIVYIQYECDKLDEYDHVPNEVIEECKDRGK